MLHTLRFSLQNAVYFVMLPFLVPVLFTFYIQCVVNLNVKFGCQKVNSRNSNCQCSLFKKKNPIILIFYTSGWLNVPINPDKWSSNVSTIDGGGTLTGILAVRFREVYRHRALVAGASR